MMKFEIKLVQRLWELIDWLKVKNNIAAMSCWYADAVIRVGQTVFTGDKQYLLFAGLSLLLGFWIRIVPEGWYKRPDQTLFFARFFICIAAVSCFAMLLGLKTDPQDVFNSIGDVLLSVAYYVLLPRPPQRKRKEKRVWALARRLVAT